MPYSVEGPMDSVERSANLGYFRRLALSFISGNWFYVASMILMVYGCHKLVQNTVQHGTEAEFSRTVLSLTILQAYELLVISTAILVTRRLKILSDAATLVAVEVALLMDPTFFANSFLTMPGKKGVLVCLGCFLLVPVKLALLNRVFRLLPGSESVPSGLTTRTHLALVAASILIYLAPWPLDQGEAPFGSVYGYYYLLGLAIPVVAVCFPSMREAIHWPSAAPAMDTSYHSVTRGQTRWIPRLVVGLVLVIVASHYVESARVYTLGFYPANAALILLAAGALLITNGRRNHPQPARRAAYDILSVMAVLLSTPWLNVPDKADYLRPVSATPVFVASSWPLSIAVGTVLIGYLCYWLLLKDAAMLRRLGLATTAGIGAVLWKSGAVSLAGETMIAAWNAAARFAVSMLDAGKGGLAWLGDYLIQALQFVWILTVSNPTLTLWVILAAALIVAWKYPKYTTWFTTAVVGLLLLAIYLPGSPKRYIVEYLESVVLIGIVLSHWFRIQGSDNQRKTAAILLGIAATIRFARYPGATSGGFLLLEIGALMMLAWMVRESLYRSIAYVQLAFATLTVGKLAVLEMSAAVITIAAGLVLFALAVLVTFQKSRILVWIHPPSPAHVVSHEADLLSEEKSSTDQE